MMQSVSFFMQYAEEVSMLMNSGMIVFLLVILHRINGIRKWIQKEEACVETSVQTQAVSEKAEEVEESTGQAEVPDADNVQTQTELLTAVLDEVFL